MENPQLNKLGMYLILIAVLVKFSEIIAQVPALVRLVAAFKALAGDINSISQETGLGTAGKTKEKQSAASTMAEKVASLVGCLHAYATDKEDEDLMYQSEISETDVIKARDAERAAFCTKRVDLVEQNKAVLVDWGVTDEDIAEARQSITDYSDSLSKRDSAKTEQTGERGSVEKMFVKADRMLYRQIDKMAKKLGEKHPDFYAEYQSARVIRDVAATRKGDGAAATTEVGAPAVS